MNPDKLFDYLDGKLPDGERRRIEQQLVSDTQLQRELSMAREIHSRMHGDSREVLLPDPIDAERGRKLARRIGIAFIVLMAVNVGAGLWIIARQESANPNRKLLDDQMREQLTKSLEHAAGSALPTPTLQVDEVKISVAGGVDTAASEVITAAEKFGGSGTKGLRDENGLLVFAEVPLQHTEAFLERLSRFGVVPSEAPRETTPNGKTKIRMRIVEQAQR